MLDSEVIDPSDQLKSAIFAPVTAPRISGNPVLDAIILTPAGNTDNMVSGNSASFIDKYPRSIISQFVSNSHDT